MSKKNKPNKFKGQNKQQVNQPIWTLKNSLFFGVVVLMLAAIAYFLFFKKSSEPQFVKQGEVTFYKNSDRSVLSKIDVEVAGNPTTRAQGLMYRKSMDESNGMLFIFEKPEIHQFWMKNTFIPLDIAFIDSAGVIDTIYRKTTPLSERSLPARRKVQFVVEVNGGFSDKNGIKEGDLISFNVDKK